LKSRVRLDETTTRQKWRPLNSEPQQGEYSNFVTFETTIPEAMAENNENDPQP